MTKHKTVNPDIIPGFDVLEWKREIQARFYQETKDMTGNEFLEYIRKGNEQIREERRLRQAAFAGQSADTDH